MNRLPYWRWLLGWLAAVLLAATPGHALLRFNESHDQVYVTGSVAMGWNSNLFSNQVANADSTYNASLLIEYQRKAGYIGVNAGLGWDFGRFQKFTSENFANPHASLEFTKDTGRTHYSLLLKAARQSSADTAANVRTESLTYGADLNWNYPDFITQRYKLSGSFGWSQLNYQSNTALTNLATYTGSLDLIYLYNDERNLFGGYRVRLSDTSSNTRDVDHNFSLGVSGRVFPKTTGSLRLGYQIRQSGVAGGAPTIFTGISAAAILSYAASKRTTFSGQLSKDFSTTSTDISTDSLTANLNVNYAYNAKFSVFANLGGGINKFLGLAGGGRCDYDLTWGAGLNWTYNDHFKASLAYDWFRNWSNLARADFVRSTVNLTLTSRW